MLQVTCDFSVTVSTDGRPYTDFMNHKLGESVESYCEANLLEFRKIAERKCRIHWWFYEPRTKELICICNVSDVQEEDGRLLIKDGNSRGILSISEYKFKEYDDIQQGSFAYTLKIWTESDVYQTARNLFPPIAHTVSFEPQVLCDPIPSEENTYRCVIVHYNFDHVTWEYPENWVGPARYLRNITYDESNITVQVVGMHWPPKHSIDSRLIHVDTVMAVDERTTDICRLFFEKIDKPRLKSLKKCRLEFVERGVTIQPKFLAKLNLLMEVTRVPGNTNERKALGLAKLLKQHEGHCIFPVNLREDSASYGMHIY
ncbi:unnamed protein product [Dicrocoelium dendriticum]|nr:unnamed protein product [Dicrocoelium dendriticum]